MAGNGRRFYELTNHWPEQITVISYNLKEARFHGSHRTALRWPEERFKFVGTQLPTAAAGAAEGEVGSTVALGGEQQQGWAGAVHLSGSQLINLFSLLKPTRHMQ
jgi:hypothetical protein